MISRILAIALLCLFVGIGIYLAGSTPQPQTVRGFVHGTITSGDTVQLNIELADETGSMLWYTLPQSVRLQIYARSLDGSYATAPTHGPQFDPSMTLQGFVDLAYRTSSPYALKVMLTLDHAGNVLTISELPTEQ